MFNTLNVQYNRSTRPQTTNLYAYVRDVAGQAGIAGVSTDPFSWGVPSLSFTSVERPARHTPTIRTDQTLTVSMTQMKLHKRHSFRWGGDFRWMLADSRTDSNPRGSFVFTGVYTGYSAAPGEARGRPARGWTSRTSSSGMSQQATLQLRPGHGPLPVARVEPLFQDDWRVNAKFTINAGLRYEYLTPYWEANDKLVNLDANADFTACRAGHRRPDGAVHGRVPDERGGPGSQQPRAAHGRRVARATARRSSAAATASATARPSTSRWPSACRHSRRLRPPTRGSASWRAR